MHLIRDDMTRICPAAERLEGGSVVVRRADGVAARLPSRRGITQWAGNPLGGAIVGLAVWWFQ